MIVLSLLLGCDPAPEDIARAIGSENPVIAEDGSKIAQNFDDPVVVAALVKVLSDRSEKVRLNAIESLAELEAVAAIPALIDSLNGDPSPKVRRAACDALGRLVAKEAIPDIIAYVDGFSPDDREQLAGVWALGNIGSNGLDPDLKKATLATLVDRRDKSSDKFIVFQANNALRILR